MSAVNKQAVTDGLMHWTKLLGDGTCNETPYQIFVGTYDAANADVAAYSFFGGELVNVLFA